MRLHILNARAVLVLLPLAFGCGTAVLNAPPTSTLTLSASPTTIPPSGGESTIRAIVRLPTGDLVPDGIIVNFFATLGTIEGQATTTSGVATVRLKSGGVAGKSVVSALSGGAPIATIEVVFGAGEPRVRLSFVPAVLPEGGGQSRVTVRVTDAAGLGLAGQVVTLTATASAKLGSGGTGLTTDASGSVSDTLTTTATTSVTATLTGLSISGSGTLVVTVPDVANLVLFASPVTLPTLGGDSVIRAFVTNASGAPVAGVAVTFTATQGSVTPASAVTDSSGFALVTLSTTATSRVTAKVGAISTPIDVTVGGSASVPYTITLSAARTSATDRTRTGVNACATASGNPHLPITIIATVTSNNSLPISGIPVSLAVKTGVTLYEGRGGFCVGSAPTATCCIALPNCPVSTPTPNPTPSPLPSPTPICDACGPTPPPLRLQKNATLVSGVDGVATFSFSFDDIDLCECLYVGRVCTATIQSSAPSSSSANSITISFAP